jgi:hypothetical protein
MAYASKDNLEWVNVTVATDLDDAQKEAYDMFQEAKTAFEDMMQAYAPPGHRAVFSHRGKAGTFGMAMTKAATAKPTLQQWLAQRKSQGRSA